MDSFEDLGLAPELIDLLAAEGIERPTPFQEQALPLVRRGNNVVGRAGPGAGTLVAWGAGLLERLIAPADETGDEEPDGAAPTGSGPRAVVLAATSHASDRLARSLARLARPLEVRVASVGGRWVLPDRADVLFGSPREILEWVREGRTSLGAVETVVVDQITAAAALEGLDALETLFDFVPSEAQRVVLDVPTRDVRARSAQEAAEDFIERHLRKAVTVPPGTGGPDEEVPDRGSVRYRIVDEPAEEGGLALVADLLGGEELRHLVVFFRDEDRAADVGDFLALHGYAAGAPGDPAVPVWLAVEELPAREAMDGADEEDGVGVLSWDVPADPDSLDRRHGRGRGGWILVLPREVPHLRDVARRTGYALQPAPPAPESRIPDDLVRTVDRVATALEEEDVGAYLLVLETLFEEHDPAEVAAAAVALLRKRTGGAAPGPSGAERERSPGAAASPGGAGTPAAARRPAWVRLYVSIGRKDRAGPGDIVGAIAGETGVDGSKVGRIEIRDSFSVVEVEEAVAEQVIRGLNGTTVKGRSVRADYDRGGQRRGTAPRGKRPRASE